ncbi:MAG: acetylxylan esterase [Alistipes sp.]|nr:acetylxylan esterase [Alistipes sp.]
MKTFRTFMAMLMSLALAVTLNAQPPQRYIRVQVAAENPDWHYSQGEKIKFDVSVIKNNSPLENVEIWYEISEDMMPARSSGTLTLRNGTGTIDGGTMDKPGFLRCRVWTTYDGNEYEGMATAGVDSQDIEPTVKDPADFDEFWGRAKAQLAEVPVAPIATLLPDQCTATVDVYQVSLLLPYNARVYGILTKPKAEGKYPVMLQVPGAGIRPYYGDLNTAEQGFIVLQMGIHGIPANLPTHVYADLSRGALSNYMRIKIEDKDNYYFKRVCLGCIRGIDYLTSLPEFDGENVIVRGGSQGGALSIVTAGLDDRITALAANYPALSDMAGHHYNRAGGWPHMFRDENDDPSPAMLETLAYYDVVNFARRVRAPGIYVFGYNDMTCPPTSVCAALNMIPAPKEIVVAEELGHWQYPEQNAKSWEFLMKAIGG